jgi:hypothetical protein
VSRYVRLVMLFYVKTFESMLLDVRQGNASLGNIRPCCVRLGQFNIG